MSIDESIMVHVGQDYSPPTIRLYGWLPPAVSIGYFQGLAEEVDLEKCKDLGIDYIRRITGGGAVFHEHEVTYSLTIPEIDPLIPHNVLDSYKVICQGIIEGLGSLGIGAEFVPLNDIIVGGKKISGSAQTRRNHTVLQHGTVLIDTDVDKMFSILKVPSEKIKDKLISDVKERVTSINSALGKEVDFNKVCLQLAKGFERSLGIELQEGELKDTEITLANEIKRDRYANPQWNHRK
ncbi:MAG: lipoate--protein ligase family protein [Thermoplasmata archaeon]|nr:MAG: lipoate--protein ligase family protein [Thermoplasmata archaeon]